MSSWRSFSRLSNFQLPTEKHPTQNPSSIFFPFSISHPSLSANQFIDSSVSDQDLFHLPFLEISISLIFEFEAHPLAVKTTKYVFVLLWREGGILAGFFKQLLHCWSF